MSEKKLGRPSSYNPEIAALICRHVAAGMKAREIATAAELPSVQTIYTWLFEHDSFLEQWQRARAASVEALAEEIREIADDNSNDVLRDPQGRPMSNMAAVKRAELRVSHRQWLMAKWSERYRDKQLVEHSGTVTLELGSRLDAAIRYRTTIVGELVGETAPALPSPSDCEESSAS